MNGKFVVVEGIDNVGKTTLSKCIVEKIGSNAIYLKTPVEPFLTKCKNFDLHNNSESLKERFELFVEGIKYSSIMIEEYRREGKIVIVDRWIWTTLAYHFAKDDILYSSFQNKWEKIVKSLSVPNANYFIIVSDISKWENRQSEKRLSVGDIQLVNNINLRKRIIDLFTKLNPSFEVIDNSGTIKNSVDAILASLTRHAII